MEIAYAKVIYIIYVQSIGGTRPQNLGGLDQR